MTFTWVAEAATTMALGGRPYVRMDAKHDVHLKARSRIEAGDLLKAYGDGTVGPVDDDDGAQIIVGIALADGSARSGVLARLVVTSR